ncbi:MAG: kinase [Pseudomonadota bacterium]
MHAGEWVARNWQQIIGGLPTTRVPILGIAGAQGSGKSWLARAIAAKHPGNVALFSLDDFYLTKAERLQLAKSTHPNLATRGVPGTHDVALLRDVIEAARTGTARSGLVWPRFDKLRDDRMAQDAWCMATPPFDLILLEGWCIGCQPQPDAALAAPVNRYEAQTDPDQTWRTFVNRKLKGPYAKLFKSMDAVLFLKAPGFESVHAWRLEQERQAYAAKTETEPAELSENIAQFIQCYERLTRHMLSSTFADTVLPLDNHRQVLQ